MVQFSDLRNYDEMTPMVMNHNVVIAYCVLAYNV